MSDWQPIKTHPTDERPFRVKMEDGHEFNVSLQDGFLREDETEACSFVAEEGEDYPECWTDGVCWGSNADDVASEYPVFWRPIDG